MNQLDIINQVTNVLQAQLDSSVGLSESEVDRNIEKLTEFCNRHSWSVEYSNKKTSRYHNNIITLCRARKKEILYYIFLHEVGHAWMLECDFTYSDRYPELLRVPPRYATATYKIARVQEEIEAWEVGKKLARSLNLRVNTNKFEKIRAECLNSYMNWAGKPRKKNGTRNHDTESINGIVEEIG
jgi:hypothetical protein